MSSNELFIEPYRPRVSINILIIVIIIIGLCIVFSKRDYIIKNWNNEDIRCNPIIMLTSPFYGKPLVENTKDCLSSYFKNEIQGELSVIKDKIGQMDSIHQETNNKMSSINKNHFETKNLFSGLLKNVNNVFSNLILNIKKDAIKGKSMINKFSGVVSSLMYIVQGVSDTGSSFVNGPIYKILTKLGGLCFSKNVKIKLKNGEEKNINKLKLNDVLENGSVVNGLVKLNNVYKEPFYTFKHNKNILVTETHLVFDEQNNKFIQVKDHPHAVLTDQVEKKLYNLVTSDHLIKIGNYTFWDYED